MSVFLVEILSSHDKNSQNHKDLTTPLPQFLLCSGQRGGLEELGEVLALLAMASWQVPLKPLPNLAHTTVQVLPGHLHFYLRMLENIFSYGIQVRGVLDVADVVSHSLDHHITWRQDQLVGPDLRKQAHMSKC